MRTVQKRLKGFTPHGQIPARRNEFQICFRFRNPLQEHGRSRSRGLSRAYCTEPNPALHDGFFLSRKSGEGQGHKFQRFMRVVGIGDGILIVKNARRGFQPAYDIARHHSRGCIIAIQTEAPFGGRLRKHGPCVFKGRAAEADGLAVKQGFSPGGGRNLHKMERIVQHQERLCVPFRLRRERIRPFRIGARCHEYALPGRQFRKRYTRSCGKAGKNGVVYKQHLRGFCNGVNQLCTVHLPFCQERRHTGFTRFGRDGIVPVQKEFRPHGKGRFRVTGEQIRQLARARLPMRRRNERIMDCA